MTPAIKVPLAFALAWVVATAAGAEGIPQNLADSFDRQDLSAGPIAWSVSGEWAIDEGRLVNRTASGLSWPHHYLTCQLDEPLAPGGVVRIEGVHHGRVPKGGYLGLRMQDSATGAYVEWNSHCSDERAQYRTSDTAPRMMDLPRTCAWKPGVFCTYALRWVGHNDEADKGFVELLFSPETAPTQKLEPLGMVEVARLRRADRVAVVFNASDQGFVAPSVAFDSFQIVRVQAPPAPRGLDLERSGANELRLSWHRPSQAGAIVVSRRVGAAGRWEDIARLPGTAQTYADARVRAGLTHRYRVCSQNDRGRSSWTRVVSALVPGPPLPPADVRSRARGSGLVWVDWTLAGENEERVIVQRRAGPDAAWEDWRTLPRSSLCTHDVLGRAATRQYRVRAENALGQSEWSPAVAAVRPASAPTILWPAGPVIHARPEDLPATSVVVQFDQEVRSTTGWSPKDVSICAAKHPWQKHALPKPRVTAVSYRASTRQCRIEFAPAIPDATEYRLQIQPSVRSTRGEAVAAGPVRVGVLLGDDDGDGLVAPAPGERLGKRAAMPPMPIGIMAEDIEWNKAKREHNVARIIELMDAYAGIDAFRINLWWAFLEPEHGRFDAEYLDLLRGLLREAEERQLPIEIGIRQVRWPLWACGHAGFSRKLYEPEVAAWFADTWRRLATVCHEYPVVCGYWPISEEYPGRSDADAYVRYVNTVTRALREAHPGCVVKPRPAAAAMQGGHEVTPMVTQRGEHDVCMAATAYPTSASWKIANPNPVAAASFNNMQAIRYYSSQVQGGPNGLGEVGFRAPPGADFGDEERLLGFERCMSLAYDVGLVEYVIWAEAWSFSHPAGYFPLLHAFRDALVREPRRPEFDLRLVNSHGVNFQHHHSGRKPHEDFAPLFQWLEGHGWKFFLTTPAAMPLQKGAFGVSFDLAALTGMPGADRVSVVSRALAGRSPTGLVLPWPSDPLPRHSLTGLPCRMEVEFLGTDALCDAVSLTDTKLQLYAPRGTRFRVRPQYGAGLWAESTTASDSRITIVEVTDAR